MIENHIKWFEGIQRMSIVHAHKWWKWSVPTRYCRYHIPSLHLVHCICVVYSPILFFSQIQIQIFWCKCYVISNVYSLLKSIIHTVRFIIHHKTTIRFNLISSQHLKEIKLFFFWYIPEYNSTLPEKYYEIKNVLSDMWPIITATLGSSKSDIHYLSR